MNEGNEKKKKFDKKKWRENKYSNKVKIQQWEERRKKVALQKYKKVLKKEGMTYNPSSSSSASKQNESRGPTYRPNSIKEAQQILNKNRLTKQKQREDKLRKRQEIDEAMKKYKKTKWERFKKLSKKTKKGQPLMGERMSLLYEKIKKSVEADGS